MSIFSKLFGGGKSGTNSAAPAGLQTFAERYATAARAHFPGMQTTLALADTPVDSRVVLTFADGGNFNQFLGNLWQQFQGNPDSAEVIFKEAFASIESTRASFEADEDTASTILPVIKTRDWHDTALAQLRQAGIDEGGEPFLVRPYVGDLVMTYVEDRPDSMNFLGAETARKRGLEGDALHAHALDNLAQLLPQLDVQGAGGRYAARLDHNYDASMVLLFEHWRERIEVSGDPVLAIAARDELLICGTGDTETVVQLQKMAESIVEQSAYALTNRLFVWRADRLVSLLVASKGDDIVLVEAETGTRLN